MKKPVARCPRPAGQHSLTVTSLLLDLSLARLFLTLLDTVLGAPFRTSARWASTAWHLALALRRFLLRLLGYMAAPPRAAALRQLGAGFLEMRRWHLAAGAGQRLRVVARTSLLPLCLV